MPQEAYVFAQFLRLLSRYEFQRIVEKYNGDYRTKQFKCWHQLTCMMFAHIRQENSLRDIEIALKWTRVVSHPVDKSLGLRADQEILVASTRLKKLYPQRLRKISFRDETQGRTLVFLTNNFALPAQTIAALYKARWEIELFFKWIKQNLRVKTFYGTSPNAVKTQIWIAMIVYLVLAILRERYEVETSLSKLLHFLEVNLFEQKPLISIFQSNARTFRREPDKQLKLFDL
jgi:IS4 transposase